MFEKTKSNTVTETSSDSIGKRHLNESIKLKDNPKYAKYLKMLKMNIPRAAIENKMRMEGLFNFDILDKYSQLVHNPDSEVSRNNITRVKLKDNGKYCKFFKMMKMNIPRPAIENKMKMAGLTNFHILDKNPEDEYISEDESEYNNTIKDSKEYEKFFAMLKMNIPREAIENKMRLEGKTNFSILDKNPENIVCSNIKTRLSSIMFKDHEKYGKFFKMLKMGIPKMVVENKMKIAGLLEQEIRFIDLDPNSFVPMELPIIKPTITTKTSNNRTPLVKKPKIEPREKIVRRKVHWKSIPLNTTEIPATCIWRNMKLFDLEESDKIEILRLFTCKMKPNIVQTPKNGFNVKKREKKKTLLQMQRSNNISIVLSRFSSLGDVPKAIQRALITLELPDQVSQEEFLSVLNLTPTDQEEKKLKSFMGNKTNLGKAEIFFFSLLALKRYKQKIVCFKFKLKLDSKYEVLVNDLELVIEGCSHLLKSKKFAKMLSLLLTVGNLINGTSDKKRIRGFKIESLLKFSNTKSFFGNHTVLSFVTHIFAEKHRELLGYINEYIDLVSKVSAIPFNYVVNDVKQLGTHFQALSNEYTKLHNAIEREKSSLATSSNSFEKKPLFLVGDSTIATYKVEENNLLKPQPKENKVLDSSCKDLALHAAIDSIEKKGSIKDFISHGAKSNINNTFLESIKNTKQKVSISTARNLSVTKDPYDTITQEDELFFSSLQKVYTKATYSLDHLRTLSNFAEEKFKELVGYLHEDDVITCDTLFSTIYRFMKEVKIAWKKAEEKKFREAKRVRETHG